MINKDHNKLSKVESNVVFCHRFCLKVSKIFYVTLRILGEAIVGQLASFHTEY